MNRSQARAFVSDTFTHGFDKARFRIFVHDLLNHFDESKAAQWTKTRIKDAFKDHVQWYERLGTYTTPNGETLDVLIVHLTADSKLERSRTSIRNFVADHLKQRDEKDAALVAFVSPSESSWRFSYIRMEYATVQTDSGKVGVEARLTPARRFSYIVGEGESCHTAQSRFLNLLGNDSTDPALAQIEEAFSVEAVTKEFFEKYAELFGDIHAALEKMAAKNKAIRDEFASKGIQTVDFAKKLMGQIVFLYFLQKKGWLGVERGKSWGTGPHDLLRKMASGAYGEYKNFFNDILEPLFYNTLATDRGHEAWCDGFKCRIPFLNGGLFEPLGDYDWRNIDIPLPNELFTNAKHIEEGVTGSGVLDVFDRYNFTVNEAEPLEQEVAIDPEMLGKVFENLIEENRRKGLGAFYTPREIVHYMCQQSLVHYLHSSLNEAGAGVSREDVDTFVRLGEQISHYEAVDTSYPVKMPKPIQTHARAIDEKLAAITVCDPAVGSGAFPVGMMTEIVRCRTALTPYFNDPNERNPYHFKRHAIQHCLYGVDVDAGAVEIAKLRLWLSLVVDEEESKQIKPLPNLDFKIVGGNSLLGFPYKSHGLSAVESLKLRFFEETDHSRKSALKREIEKTLLQCFSTSKKDLGYTVNFDFRINFSEVFERQGGFDVVLANPPYGLLNKRQNRHESIVLPDEELQFYKTSAEYAAARGGMINIFRLFVVKSMNILRNGGYCTEIFPLAFACDSSAASLRKELMDRHRIIGLEAFPERDNEKKRVFEAVKMSVCILLAQKATTQEHFSLRIHRDRYVDTSNEIAILHPSIIKAIDEKHCTIPLLVPEDLALLEHLYSVGKPLRALGHCYTGEIDLSLDKEYLSDDGRKAVMVKGAIIDRYLVRTKMSQGEIMFLDAKKYLANNHGERSAHHRSQRIALQGITGVNEKIRLKMTLVGPGTFCANSVNYIILNDSQLLPEYLLGVLNSRILNFVFSMTSTNSNVNGYEVDNLPIVIADRDTQKTIANLVSKIIATKERHEGVSTDKLEQEVEQIVGSIYRLTDEQITRIANHGQSNGAARAFEEAS
jgi:Alw26I/Eco31I/Esp3I family type II restriction m6 adenine DNA methyltransferase